MIQCLGGPAATAVTHILEKMGIRYQVIRTDQVT